MGIQILLTDLMDVKHGDAVLEVEAKKASVKGNRGYRGYVLVKFPKNPTANYTVPVEGDALRIIEGDAYADAIALRKDIIAMNKIIEKSA